MQFRSSMQRKIMQLISTVHTVQNNASQICCVALNNTVHIYRAEENYAVQIHSTVQNNPVQIYRAAQSKEVQIYILVQKNADQVYSAVKCRIKMPFRSSMQGKIMPLSSTWPGGLMQFCPAVQRIIM